MTECPIYMYVPQEGKTKTLPADDPSCVGCSCGYVQYEGLIPYLREIRDSALLMEQDEAEFEHTLREQVIEISRLFDMEAGVVPGYFSTAHRYSTKVYPSSGRYLRVPPHIEGTLEVYDMAGNLVDPSLYRYQDGHLVYLPCVEHKGCSCTSTCGGARADNPVKWQDKCYQIRAKWGQACADMAVQKAVRDFLIETYRLGDPVIQSAAGIPIQRRFAVPYSWTTYLKTFKSKNKIFSMFAIA